MSSGQTKRQWQFLHGKKWCPVSSEVRFDVSSLPCTIGRYQANVCAGNTAEDMGLAQTYCSAIDYTATKPSCPLHFVLGGFINTTIPLPLHTAEES